MTSRILSSEGSYFQRLISFWARRILRILPASLFTLLVVSVLVFFYVPMFHIEQFLGDIKSANFYFLNWSLVIQKSQYLQSNLSPSPVLNYWSLSLEEQFYIVWPIILFLLLFLNKRKNSRVFLGFGITLLGVISFIACLQVGRNSTIIPYYSTPLRIWEFCFGAIAFLFLATNKNQNYAMSKGIKAVSLIFFLTPILLFTNKTHYPGFFTLLPVVGATMFLSIVLHHPKQSVLEKLFELRISQWIGDRSYSIYLWHYPLLILAPYVLATQQIGNITKCVVLLIVLASSHYSTKLIENPFRFSNVRVSTRLLIILVSVIFVAFVSNTMQSIRMNVNSNHSSEQLLSTKLELGKIQDAKPQPQIASSPAKMDSNKLGFSIGSTSCSKGFMQGALDNCLVANKSGPILPSLDQPDLAIPPIFKSQECGPRVDDGENLRLCKFGILGSKKKLAVVGNSHALQWVDALSDSNSNPGFEVTSFAGPILAIDPPSYYSITQADNIVKLSQQIVEMTKGNKYQIVFWTQWVSQVFIPAGKNLDWLKSQYQNIIMTYKNSGTPLVILRDNPNPQYTNTSVPDCLFNNPSNYLKCQGISYSWILEDPLADVAQSMDVPVISLNDLMCFDGNCPSVINGIRVYLDDNHLTSQWTQKVSPILWKRLVFLITK